MGLGFAIDGNFGFFFVMLLRGRSRCIRHKERNEVKIFDGFLIFNGAAPFSGGGARWWSGGQIFTLRGVDSCEANGDLGRDKWGGGGTTLWSF